MKSVEELLTVLDAVIHTPESELDENIKTARMQIYADSNDAFKDLLMGKFGRLPLGFPPDWVYHSATRLWFDRRLSPAPDFHPGRVTKYGFTKPS